VDEAEPSDTSDTETKTEEPAVRRIEPRAVDETETAVKPGETQPQPAPAPIESEAEPSPRHPVARRPVATDESPACDEDSADRATDEECMTKQLALALAPTDDRGAGESEISTSAAMYEPEDSTAEAATDLAIAESPGGRGDTTITQLAEASAPATDPILEDLLDGLLPGDALTDSVTGSAASLDISDGAANLAVAGVFAVALSKPLSRLTTPSTMPAGDPTAAVGFPILWSRRRKEANKTGTRTKDRPEELDDPDDDLASRADRTSAATPRELREIRAATLREYESFEAALATFADADDDDSQESSNRVGNFFVSARTVAAGALAAATAWLSLQGNHRSQRQRLRRQPATPTYHGPTAVAN